MADIKLQILLPTGTPKSAEVPDDAPMRELLPELVTALTLPVLGPDGRPVGYRLDSKRLGRPIQSSETLAAAGVTNGDTLIIVPDVVAGGGRW